MSFRSITAVLALSLILAGCATDSTDPTMSSSIDPPRASLITPMCQAGCLGPGPDPSPEEPGEWLGTDFTDDVCIGGSSDYDFDSVGDLCEFKLAEAFAPELVTWTRQDGPTAEDVGGERYWAVRYVSGSSPFQGMIMLVFLPAYYYDLGDPESGLTAHPGDSEVIVLYVQYNASTQHWVLKAAHLSQHTYWGYAGSDLGDPNSSAAMEYPGRTGGYPRVWAAKFKHANYVSRSSCQAGGFLGADDCDALNVSAQWRFPVYSNHNLGSWDHRFVDCVSAQFRSGWHSECMWATSGKFQGWMYEPDPDKGGEPHGSKLQIFGFVP